MKKIIGIFALSLIASTGAFSEEPAPSSAALSQPVGGLGEMPADVVACHAVMGDNCPKYIEWKNSQKAQSKGGKGVVAD